VVSSVATLITLFIMVFIIPKFEKFYAGMGATLPLPTRILLFWSKLVAHNIVWIILGAIVGAILLRRYIQTPEGKFKKDSLKLTLPIIGSLFRKVAVAKFTRTLSTLVRSGVNIITALEIVAKTAGNVVVEQAVIKTKMSIQEGESISVPLAQTGVFPTMVTRMIAVGERTGALEEMLQKIAVFYEEQVDTAVNALTSLIEPILIVVMGIMIGGIVICMYLPIFNLVNALSK
jgi:type IV pilus assembly protein PilC